MRVALAIRADARQSRGGDLSHVEQTAESLASLGIEADIMFGEGDCKPYDLVHVFNLTRSYNSVVMAERARLAGKPYVVTPIWHSLAFMADFYGTQFGLKPFPIKQYLAMKEFYYERTFRAALIGFPRRWERGVRDTLIGAAAVLPNSPEEEDTIQRELGVALGAVRVVPVGIADEGLCREHSERDERLVVCAGRIEPRKNTLSVVKAFLQTAELNDYRLVLLGGLQKRHHRYARAVLSLVDGHRVEWRGEVGRREALRMYGRAAVVILASYFETCGLVGLEGLAAGARVVMSTRGYNEFYYGDSVCYCDPYSVASIAEAIVEAASRLPVALGSDLIARFGWTRVARLTAEVYEWVLRRDREALQ